MSLFAALAEAAALLKCDRVGRGVRLTGAPWIENEGRLELGDEVKLVSLPVQSHLVVAERAALLIGARVTIHTRQPVLAAQIITSWALDGELDLAHFSVAQPSLEDIYLELTGSGGHEQPVQPVAEEATA